MAIIYTYYILHKNTQKANSKLNKKLAYEKENLKKYYNKKRPVINSVTKVPRTGSTFNFSVNGLFKYRKFPKFRRHRLHSE